MGGGSLPAHWTRRRPQFNSLSAIDHVEILTDGASAIYGSDAVAGVVNFVLKKNFDGAETEVQYAIPRRRAISPRSAQAK